MNPEEVNGLVDLLISTGRWYEVASRRPEIRMLRYHIDADDGGGFHALFPIDEELGDYERALEGTIKVVLQFEEPLASMVKFLYSRQCRRGLLQIVDLK